MVLKWGRQYIHLQGSSQKTVKGGRNEKGNLYKTKVSVSILKAFGILTEFMNNSSFANILLILQTGKHSGAHG